MISPIRRSEGRRGRLPRQSAAGCFLACLLPIWILSALPIPAAQPPSSPNVVVIVADDLGWNDVGYHGSEIQTPNLDRLAAEGTQLNQFYAYSTCSPTRVALLTGQNPARFQVHGPLGSGTEVGPDDMHLTFGLGEAGYTTHITGKWHIGETPEHRPLRHGFSTSYGYLRGQIDPYTHRYKFGDHVTWHRNDHFIEEEGHVTDLITDEAVRVIETASEVRQAPFFLYVAHHTPHYPLNEPPKWIEPYEDTWDDVWRQHFAGAVTHMDHGVGRIVDALERTGQRDDTMIVFFSDNGGQRSWGSPDSQYNGRYAAHTTLGDNRPLRGWKGSLYEGAIRLPAFVNWPGVTEPGSQIDAPTHVLDWAPTLLHLADPDTDHPPGLDGTNLRPILTGEKPETSLADRQFYWRQGGQRAVRQGDWKLIARGGDLDNPELFHLGNDPYEENEVGEESPEKRQKLLQQAEAWPW